MGKYRRVGQATDDSIIGRMRFAYWMHTATDTLSEYVLLITFPRQQWLCELALMLNYTYVYIACFVCIYRDNFSYILICLAGLLLLLLLL
jgi:hypothetical protein